MHQSSLAEIFDEEEADARKETERQQRVLEFVKGMPWRKWPMACGKLSPRWGTVWGPF
jgi:hypothetical protein